WPFGNARSLGQRLGQLRRVVQLSFDMKVTEDLHTKQNVYIFAPRVSRDSSRQKLSNPLDENIKVLPPSTPALPAKEQRDTFEGLFPDIPKPKLERYPYRAKRTVVSNT